jgi:hypothetical protein
LVKRSQTLVVALQRLFVLLALAQVAGHFGESEVLALSGDDATPRLT